MNLEYLVEFIGSAKIKQKTGLAKSASVNCHDYPCCGGDRITELDDNESIRTNIVGGYSIEVFLE